MVVLKLMLRFLLHVVEYCLLLVSLVLKHFLMMVFTSGCLIVVIYQMGMGNHKHVGCYFGFLLGKGMHSKCL